MITKLLCLTLLIQQSMSPTLAETIDSDKKGTTRKVTTEGWWMFANRKKDEGVILNGTNCTTGAPPHLTENLPPYLMCQNIQEKILKSAKISLLNFKGMEDVYEQMSQTIGNKPVTCELVLQQSGLITDLKIIESSNSEEIDRRALEIVRNAGPFQSSDSAGNTSYTIRLPRIDVHPSILTFN
jgi:TonB family protein